MKNNRIGMILVVSSLAVIALVVTLLLQRQQADHAAQVRVQGLGMVRSLAALPRSQRAVVELVAVDGLSLTGAAQVLGISPGSARVRYHRARTRLRNVLPSPFEVTA